MAFSSACDKAGYATKVVDTIAKVRLSPDGAGFAIEKIALLLNAMVPGLDEDKFYTLAEEAKTSCALSKALAAVSCITLTATLQNAD